MNLSDLSLGSHEYQTPEVILLPYLKSKFPPDFLERLHRQLIKDNILKTVYTGMPDAEDFSAWKAYMEKQPIVLYIIKPDRLVGYGWLSEVQGVPGQRKGAFGFLFFREAWGTKFVRDLCWLSLRWWFHELDTAILFATSLKTNKLAVNFSRIFGFQKIGDLPMFFLQDGRLVDAVLIYLKKTDFDVVYDRWRSGIPENKLQARAKSNKLQVV